MVVMPSNNTGFDAGLIFGKFPKRMAHLHSVSAPREPKQGIPWALDNGVYGAFTNGADWCPKPFYSYLEKFSAWKPLWAVVPDSVGNRGKTLDLWAEHYKAVAKFGVPLAFAVQDGMSVEDVPSEAEVVFVGGSTSWKWQNLKTYTENFPRVHVGRVNSYRLLWMAHRAGAESCDGTGWFRGNRKQLAGLYRYLQESEKRKDPQMSLL